MARSWEISIRGKGSRFRFRFKARLAETRSKLLRFPALSKLYKLLVKPSTSKPKFLQRLKLSPSRSKQDAIATRKTQIPKSPEAKIPLNRFNKTTNNNDKEGDNLGTLVVGSVKSLSQSIGQRCGRGIVIHGTSVMLFALLLLMERFSGKVTRSVVFVAVGVVALGFAMRVSENVATDQASVWKAWNYAASSGSVDELSQVVFYRVWELLGL